MRKIIDPYAILSSKAGGKKAKVARSGHYRPFHEDLDDFDLVGIPAQGRCFFCNQPPCFFSERLVGPVCPPAISLLPCPKRGLAATAPRAIRASEQTPFSMVRTAATLTMAKSIGSLKVNLREHLVLPDRRSLGSRSPLPSRLPQGHCRGEL